VPTGGINKTNLKDYLRVDHVLAVGGTWIAGRADIESADWEKIKLNCIEALNLIRD
jgi:2-dehydro-3-deoxyphosphogluconate aldolase/(4S)-4-hydroxy-2-oxoglutarate aldolase